MSRARVVTYEEVVASATRLFLAEGTVDMEALAAELPVGRATLYRVVDGRDRLLGDVLWRLAARVLEHARDEAEGEGVEWLLDVSRRFYDEIMGPTPFRRFLAAEPQTALRVLLTPAGGVHERIVARQHALLAEAAARGADLPDDLDTLAYLYVRIFESMMYADLLSGRTPDVAVAERAARALLTPS